MAKASRVEVYKSRHKDLAREKAPYLPMYQLIGEYVMTRKQDFTVSSNVGEFETKNLFTCVAPNANQKMASALVGNLWPNGARSVRLTRPRFIQDNKENKQFYDDITNAFTDILDAPESGVVPALQEYMLDQGSFGISGLYSERTGNLYDPLRVSALNVKFFLIDEDKDGFIDTVFIDNFWSAKQIVERYGYNNVSEAIKKSFDAFDISTKYRVTQVIEPRRGDTSKEKGNKKYPVASVHFEWETGKMLLESGYKHMPAIITRFLKALGEKYGRSAAMFAMPAVLRANIIWELIQRCGEKKLDPPMYMLDAGMLGGDNVNKSAGAMNILNTSGFSGEKPIGTLFDVGNIQDIYPVIEALVNDITSAFHIDELMDLNNEKRMTFGEAQIRDRIRGEGLSSIFKRQEMECFSRWLNSTFDMLQEEGLLGVERGSEQEKKMLDAGLTPIYMPADVLRAYKRGQRIYKIKYISPASRIMRTEELQGITTLLDINMGAAGAFQDIIDNIDADKIEEKLYELLNVDDETKRDTKTKEAIRDARNKMLQQQQQAQAVQVASDVAMKNAQANSMSMGALYDRPRG